MRKFLYGLLASMLNQVVSRIWTWAVWTVTLVQTNENEWLRFDRKWMIEKFSCLLIIVLLIQKLLKVWKLNCFSCHPTQHKKFSLMFWGSYEIIRCIIVIYLSLLEGYEIGIQILKNMHVLDAMNLIISLRQQMFKQV
jgi:hypothetical protein